MLFAGSQADSAPCGPGCHLTRAIAWFGIRDDGTCGCAEHAAQMDDWGPDECERQIETIMGWLKDAHIRRFMYVPWVDAPARLLVMECIAAARRDADGQEAQAKSAARPDA
jgi:hypothetical protein